MMTMKKQYKRIFALITAVLTMTVFSLTASAAEFSSNEDASASIDDVNLKAEDWKIANVWQSMNDGQTISGSYKLPSDGGIYLACGASGKIHVVATIGGSPWYNNVLNGTQDSASIAYKVPAGTEVVWSITAESYNELAILEITGRPYTS